MGLLTAIRKFRYPVSTDAFNPPLDFKNLADDVDAWTGNQVLATVADNSDRDLKFPSPTQGMVVFRKDLGYEERYFEAFQATTNPGGALVAGWYPIGGGKLPFIDLWPGGAQSVGSGTQSRLVDAFWRPDVTANHKRRGFAPMSNGIITVPLTGWYDLSYQAASSSTGYGEVAVIRNTQSYVTDNVNNLGRVGGSGTTWRLDRKVLLNAGEQLAFWFMQQSGGVVPVRANNIDTWINVQYIAPPV